MATAPRTAPGPSQAERVPPQDLDAEAALLGAMLVSENAIADAVTIIGRGDTEWFYVPAHRKIFEVILDLYEDPEKAIDLITFKDELARRELLEFVGGEDYLIRLAESFADWANTEFYARIVRDKGMLRALIRTSERIIDRAYHGIDDPREIFDQAERDVSEVTARRIARPSIAIGEPVAELARLLHSEEGAVVQGAPTGFHALDERTRGLCPGDLIIIAARPSMGKTAFALNIAQNFTVPNPHMATQQAVPTAFFSMEMSNQQLAQRLVSAHSGIHLSRLRDGKLGREELHRIDDTAFVFQDAPLFIDDTPGMSPLELRSKARRLHDTRGIGAIFVDYLQLMHLPGAESRQVEIATISRYLKSIARELEVPVVALSQLNRMAEGRSDKRPLMSDLRESGAIEQDADVIMLIHREEYYKPEDETVQNQAEIIIAKQRNGPTGTVTLQFDKKLTRFANLHVGPEPYTRGGTDAAPF